MTGPFAGARSVRARAAVVVVIAALTVLAGVAMWHGHSSTDAAVAAASVTHPDTAVAVHDAGHAHTADATTPTVHTTCTTCGDAEDAALLACTMIVVLAAILATGFAIRTRTFAILRRTPEDSPPAYAAPARTPDLTAFGISRT